MIFSGIRWEVSISESGKTAFAAIRHCTQGSLTFWGLGSKIKKVAAFST